MWDGGKQMVVRVILTKQDNIKDQKNLKLKHSLTNINVPLLEI